MSSTVETGLAAANGKLPMSRPKLIGIVSISVITLTFLTTIIVIVVKKTTAPFDPAPTPTDILDAEGEKYLANIVSVVEGDADSVKEAEECEAEYKTLTDKWNVLVKTPTEELKAGLNAALKKAKAACPEDSLKKLLKADAFKLQAEEVYEKAKKEALGDVSKRKPMERALILVRLFQPGFESKSPSAAHILYESVHRKVLSGYDALMGTPDPNLAKSLKNNWTVAKALAEKIVPTKVPDIYSPKTLPEYISNSIPEMIESVDQGENKTKLKGKVAALNLFEPKNRYVQLLDSPEKIDTASDYIKKLAPLEKGLIDAMAKTSILDLEGPVQAIIKLRESLENSHDLGRLNLPPKPKFNEVLCSAFKIDSTRTQIEEILVNAVIEVFDRNPDKEKQKKVAKFVSDLKRTFGFEPTAPELKACSSDTNSLQEYFTKKHAANVIPAAGKRTHISTTSESSTTDTASTVTPTVELTDEEKLEAAATTFINSNYNKIIKAKENFKDAFEKARRASPATYPYADSTKALADLIVKKIFARLDEIVTAAAGEDPKKDETMKNLLRALYRSKLTASQAVNPKLAGNFFDFHKFFEMRLYPFKAKIAATADFASLPAEVKTELTEFFKILQSEASFMYLSSDIVEKLYDPTVGVSREERAFDLLKMPEADRPILNEYLNKIAQYNVLLNRFNSGSLTTPQAIKQAHDGLVRLHKGLNEPELLAKIPRSFKVTVLPLPPPPTASP